MQNTRPGPRSFHELLSGNLVFFLLFTTIALGFRAVFLLKLKLLTVDTFVYGDIAKNWLLHHVYGQSTALGPMPTYIRMPGYPLFLAAIWSVVGVEHYTAALIVQIVFDLGTCFLIADLARRIISDSAAKAAFVLAALCPFFANYAAAGLTETLAIFSAALALDSVVAALDKPYRIGRWVLCGIGVSVGILLRPDGGMLLGVIGLYVLLQMAGPVTAEARRREFIGAVLVAVIALAPLVPWTIRNWRTFNTLEPLTPLYANMPNEFVPHGFNRWVRTWIVDYSSVEDVWFNADGDSVDVDDIPRRAFDNPRQLQQTVQAFQAYDDNNSNMNPAIDARFAELANERIHARPLRYYVELPFLRALDLWFRPRTEILPIDAHWWRYREDPGDFAKAVVLGLVNLFYVIAALLTLGRGQVRYAGLFILFAIVRTAFLAWMPNPEPRYVLECYPAVLAMAGGIFGRDR
jgi:4-amino-4-deoxy-L-arabinose transferase-like glycosyltransferase